MKTVIFSLVVIIIQQIKTDNNNVRAYKAITLKGDTGTLFSNQILNPGDTFNIR